MDDHVLHNADRWSVDNNGGGGGQSTDAPDGFTYSLKIDPSSGNAALRQAIELPAAGEGGVFRSGQKFTLSFYLKSANAGEAINIFAASGTTVSATTTAQVNDTSTGLTTATSWTRYTYTFTSNNVGGSDTCYNIVPYVSSPSGATYWTGFQLEEGSQATPFEHEPKSVTLRKCQRYFYLETPTSTDSSGRLGVCSHSTTVVFDHTLPVQMRTKPSLSLTSASLRIGDTVSQGFTTSSGTVAQNTYSGTQSITYILGGFSGLTTYRTYLHEPDAASPGMVKFSAEF